MAYVFDPQRLHEVSRRVVGLSHAQMVRGLIDDLATDYPDHIERNEDWIMSLAGGATGIMTVLHCSLSEYLIIFGTPIGTEGFSGRYRIDIFDFLTAGEMWTYTEESYGEPVITRPGDRAVLLHGQVKGFRIAHGSWMLEYGRGPIITCLPMALSDAITSLDGTTIWKTLSTSARLAWRELRRGKV
jgi:ERG2 and Sigma1 receptor like protein